MAICAAIAIGFYVAYLLIFPSVTLRYRLTVNVDIDGVTHTGTGVVEVFYQPVPDSLSGIGGGEHFGGDLRGYAITVDLGDRGLLFVVNLRSIWGGRKLPLDSSSFSMLPFTAYGLPDAGLLGSHGLQLARELRGKSGSVNIPLQKLPMIGRFEDINDSNSGFEELDPLNLAPAYDHHVRLTRAQFEFTNAPISPMPNVWPAWLNADTDDSYTAGLHNQHLGVSAFKGSAR